jgi:hypothetical protein
MTSFGTELIRRTNHVHPEVTGAAQTLANLVETDDARRMLRDECYCPVIIDELWQDLFCCIGLESYNSLDKSLSLIDWCTVDDASHGITTIHDSIKGGFNPRSVI